jgi:hypothetical protein
VGWVHLSLATPPVPLSGAHVGASRSYRARIMNNPIDLRERTRLKLEQVKINDLQSIYREEELRYIMESPVGRRFMYRLLRKSGIFGTSFTGNSTTFFNEGARSIGLELFNDVHEECPALYLKMITEDQGN